jgi:hypothetical protein
MKTTMIALVLTVLGIACAPVEGEELAQSGQNISSSDAGTQADGNPCQVCFYYSHGGSLQGCKTSTSTCMACSLLGCH